MLRNCITSIMGKTIAIVYIFEGDEQTGLNHFYIWKSKIITQWMEAVESLKCMPLILDVRTFVDKAINNTLPHIDYVINLNSGTYSLSAMALVPSVCSSINVPCIPCNATTIVTGEEKNLSNYIAMAIGLNVPEYLPKEDPTGIFRPINFGNSMGVVLGSVPQDQKGVYQRFISGYDITTPVAYNAETGQMDMMPTVAFYPKNNHSHWYYDEKLKHSQSGYTFKTVILDERVKAKYKELVNALGINSFCRIDARVKQFKDVNGQLFANFDETFFVEINVMPTIRNNNSFNYSYNSIGPGDPFSTYISSLNEVVTEPTLNCFLLSSSMLANTKTMY